MMNNINIYSKLVIAATTLIIAGCSNSNRYMEIDSSYINQQSKNVSINYIPNINVVTKDSDLKEYIDKNTDKKFHTTSPEFSVLDLYIESSVEADPLEKAQPNLVGIIKEQYRSYNYKVNYKLVDNTGNTVKTGNTLGLSDAKVKSLATANVKASQSSVKDAAKEIVKEINSHIGDILIDFKVVSVSDTSVFIMVNDGIILSKDDIFLVNELPSTALQLNGITQENGITMAELKVLTGTFPKAGMTVNLQK